MSDPTVEKSKIRVDTFITWEDLNQNGMERKDPQGEPGSHVTSVSQRITRINRCYLSTDITKTTDLSV